MKLLVTGGAGFIGSHFIRYWLNNNLNDKIVNFDLLTYAGNLSNLVDVAKDFDDRYFFIQGDITNRQAVETVFDSFKPDVVVNFAAESHNSWAILNPGKFFNTNVMGTQILLEVSRLRGIERFQHISTCEVYGDLALDSSETFSENSPLQPRTPYNASKAAADLAVLAYHRTFNLPILISRCSNNFGPFQYPEKLIPLFTTSALSQEKLTLYKQSLNKREWVHVVDHCRAIAMMIKHGKVGEVYNVGTGTEKTIEEIADFILTSMNLSSDMKLYVQDRPSHDRRYLLDSSKIRNELGWRPEIDFDAGLAQTIQWYIDNKPWRQTIKKQGELEEKGWSQK